MSKVGNLIKSQLPRGIRNNNPGNLKLTNILWQGKVPNAQNTDGTFEQFTSMKWGIRAMLTDVKNDMVKDGLTTVRKIISEYAPPSENNTANYISVVSRNLGVSPDTKIQPTEKTLVEIGHAITAMENGTPYAIPKTQIKEGYSLMSHVLDTAKNNKGKIAFGLTALLAGGYLYYEKNS